MDGAVAAVTYPFARPPEAGAAVELAEGVLWLRLALPMRPDHVNIYALDDGDGWTVVDTGLGTAKVREAWEALLAGPLAGKPVRRVILTHHHPDHVGNVGWFQRQHGAELWATRTAWLYARMLTLDVQDTMSREARRYAVQAGMPPEMIAERAAMRPFNFSDVVEPLPLGFRRIVQGEEIVAGGRRWRVETGHGHAPEQATFWGVDHDLVLVADQVLPTISPNLGVYPTEPEADTVGEWIASCGRLRGLTRGGELALPGHKLPFHGLAARLEELLAHQHEVLRRLLDLLRVPHRAAECFDVLYGRRIGKGEYYLALAEAVGHLNHLHQRGLVRRETGPDGAYLWQEVGAEAQM